ncbi:hypothetical protein GH733_010297 [Mirounga leonina]|nr:hypothetical protein GH733_010297 [Mirounga leonina]
MGHRVKSKNIAENLGSDCSCPIKRFGMEENASPGRSAERLLTSEGTCGVVTVYMNFGVKLDLESVFTPPLPKTLLEEFLSRRRGPRRLMGNVVQKGADRPLGNPGKGGPGPASARVRMLAFRLAPFLILQVLPGARPAVSSWSGSTLTCAWCKVEAQRVQPRVRRRTGRGLRALGGRREGRGGAGPGPRRVDARSPPSLGRESPSGFPLVPEKSGESQAASCPAGLRAGALCSLSLPEEGAL